MGNSEQIKELIVDRQGQICTLILNRPEKRNSLTPFMMTELRLALDDLKREGGVRAVIIKGAGDKAFSAGYDLSAFPKERRREEISGLFRGEHPLEAGLRAIEEFPCPVIALVKGYAFGGGCELVATCDLSVASEDAVFKIPSAQLGILYGFGGVKKFLNLIGPAYTREMLLTGRTIDAKRAERIGLVNFTLPKEEAEAFAYGLAKEVAQNSPLPLSGAKSMINAWARSQTLHTEDERLIREISERVFNSEDFDEGLAAFAEKRRPIFKGR